MPYDTDTIDRLFLELSQFTQATTAKELQLKRELAAANDKLAVSETYETLYKAKSERLEEEVRERDITIRRLNRDILDQNARIKELELEREQSP